LSPARAAGTLESGEEHISEGGSMRILLAFVGALLVCTGPAQAQEKAGKKPTSPPPLEQLGGKTLDQWVKEFNTSRDPSKAENCIRTILLFGAEPAQAALPHLLAILRKHSASNPVDISIRVNSAIALGFILGNSKVEEKHVKDAVTLLTRLLRDDERIVRFRAAEALGLIGPDASSAIPDLIYTSRDKACFETRQAAAFALGSVAQDKKNGPQIRVLEALYKGLRDSASTVRMTAVQSLARLGPPADKMQRQGLERELEPVARSDADPTVQIWTHMAIMSLRGKVEDQRLAIIGKMLSSPDLATRTQAAQALAGLGKLAKKEVPRLQAGLSDPDPNVVAWCIIGLARMGKDAGDAVERLRQIANDPQQHEVLKRGAREALDFIEERAKDKEKGVKGAAK
jgi:HEAT repeat protein